MVLSPVPGNVRGWAVPKYASGLASGKTTIWNQEEVDRDRLLFAVAVALFILNLPTRSHSRLIGMGRLALLAIVIILGTSLLRALADPISETTPQADVRLHAALT